MAERHLEERAAESDYEEVTRPHWTADELLVLQRAMSGVFLDKDDHLRADILRKLAKAEMVKRRGYA